MSAVATPADMASRAAALYARRHRDWAADPAASAELDVPLKVPTERDVLADVDAAVAWIGAWREAEAKWPVTVMWAPRRWSRVGEQTVPQRARIDGPEAIATLANELDNYRKVAGRCAELRRVLGSTEAVVAALRHCAGQIAVLDDPDFVVLGGVVGWLAEHPTSGRFARELPIKGIDSKWIERRQSLVTTMVHAVTGRTSLGLAEPPRLLRIRTLDPSWSIGGIADVSMRIDAAASLNVPLDTVIVTENLHTFLALPERPGAAAIHGGGYAVDALEGLPWLEGLRVLYWGDLDSDGFAILNRARSHGIPVDSVLMDTETLHRHRDLWVPEPKRSRPELALLSEAEQDAYRALRTAGWPRLEQERVEWRYALAVLERTLARE